MLPSSPARRGLRHTLLATVLAAGALVVPVSVTLAGPAAAAPCPSRPLPLLCLAVPAADPPTVSGAKQVGKPVTASAVTWDQTGVSTTYAWYRDGEAIEGATAQTYTLTGDDFDTVVTVRASGTNSAGIPGSTDDSAPVEPALGDAITAAQAPVVTGEATPGGTLTTTSGTWPGSPEPAYAYQWYRSRPTGSGAQLITGATGTTYSPVAADAGRTIIALVTADRVGYAKGVALSNAKKVPRAASRITFTLARKTVRKTQNAAVSFAITSSAGVVATGKVHVLDGTRTIRTVNLGAAAGGSHSFTIPRLTVGQHRLTARYVGDNALAGSTSSVQVLTVTR